jgi:hypothetical protein
VHSTPQDYAYPYLWSRFTKNAAAALKINLKKKREKGYG